jgi:hypothetical protein
MGWNGPQPAPLAFWDIVHSNFPVTRNLGIYQKDADDHDEGRALDIGLLVSRPDEDKIAWGIINEVLLPLRDEIDWSYFIYNQWIWYPEPRGREKGGFKGDHTNHIHVSWDREASQRKSFPKSKTALQDLSDRLTAPPWPVGWWKVTMGGDTYYYSFERRGLVKWTSTAPNSTSQALLNPEGTGSYNTAGGYYITIRWNSSGSVEKYHRIANLGTDQLEGKYNDHDRLDASKMY